MIELSAIDKAVDVPQLLRQTEEAIVTLMQINVQVPAEATEMLAILRRCIVAEESLAQWQRFASYCRCCAQSGENDPYDFSVFMQKSSQLGS